MIVSQVNSMIPNNMSWTIITAQIHILQFLLSVLLFKPQKANKTGVKITIRAIKQIPRLIKPSILCSNPPLNTAAKRNFVMVTQVSLLGSQLNGVVKEDGWPTSGKAESRRPHHQLLKLFKSPLRAVSIVRVKLAMAAVFAASWLVLVAELAVGCGAFPPALVAP